MNLTPKQIVEELDKYIIGQQEAKKAVAVALRNRYRRSKLPLELMEDITPKNIIMKGPTGVGKTEIARRLAKLVKAPFVKVEATKFTEVGYVGRDCESMIRDLVEVSVRMVKEEKKQEVLKKAEKIAYDKIFKEIYLTKKQENCEDVEAEKTRIMDELTSGKYDNETIEIDVLDAPKNVEMIAGVGPDLNIGSIFEGIFPQKKKKRKVSIKEAKQLIVNEESDKLIDNDGVNSEAIKRAEQEGIIFIDEIDKIAAKGNSSNQDVSREGVQRDILPFVEGTSVQTKYGSIKTDYILFIAAGAFHVAKMEDLIPELQGRFPIIVELTNLTKEDFYRILKEPKNALIKQYTSLLKVDNIDLEFTDDALNEIAYIAEKENETSENIGARRLHTIMEKILQDLSFNASGDYPETKVVVDKEYIDKILNSQIKKYDLKKYVL
ncbi:MAG: ATP-dependent protease ATPase subunit HslU [Clostridiales bacterium]|nr:ATP-dependent protease ATPase subunit HslU [Candidatus Apopatousia equi]